MKVRRVHSVLAALTLAFWILSHFTEDVASSPPTGAKDLEKPTLFSCEELHSIYPSDGLNIFKQKLIGFLGEVSCSSPKNTRFSYVLSHGNLLNHNLGRQTSLSVR